MKTLANLKFDEERALYGSVDVCAEHCSFDGPADGESAFKESKNIEAKNCFFNLRYPFWHDDGLKISDSTMTEKCRAALWYTRNAQISNSSLHGIKALRECGNIEIDNCDIISPEFGWSVSGIEMKNSSAESEYFMMRSSDLKFSSVSLKGKYSFQYIENGVFENCSFDTKDAFWHAKNVTVRNSKIKGEYLAWYSENLTLINCTISGTQPFCYCKGLKLVNCIMLEADLCFEKSEVEAEIITPVLSIKNPASGRIQVPSVGEIIMDDPAARGVIEIKRSDILCLNKPGTDISKEADFVRDMPEDENGMTNDFCGISREKYESDVLPLLEANEKGEQLPEGYVPETVFFLWDKEEIVGQFHLRHHLCPSLENGSGHIGYYVAPEHRGKGYATEGLRLTLEEAKRIVPEDEIYLRVLKSNPSSLRVMFKNGGYVHHEDGEHIFVRIKK